MTTSWMKTVASTTLVLDIEAAKSQCSVSTSSLDERFDAWIRAAIDWVESYTFRGLLTQTYRMTLSEFPISGVQLPYASPLQSITSVTYFDDDNAEQTLATSNYLAMTAMEPGRLEPTRTAIWPSLYPRPDAVRITYVVGVTAPDLVEPALLQAVTLLVGHYYANRESVLVGAVSKEIEFAVTALCAHYRRFWSTPC